MRGKRKKPVEEVITLIKVSVLLPVASNVNLHSWD